MGESVLLGLRFIKDVGDSGADRILRERKRGGAYTGAGDLVRRTGLKPQAVESLVMAGAFDSITPNRRQALWEAGLHPRPSRNGQAVLPSLDGRQRAAACGLHGRRERWPPSTP